MKNPFKETDLYPHLKTWLESNGYLVHAEVGHCDIAAVKGDELVLIEMKKSINLDLLLQVVRRQSVKAAVYAAVPVPRINNRAWRERVRLLKRLEVGLLVVSLHSARPQVRLLFHPIRQRVQASSGKTKAFLREIHGRSKDLNQGGSRGVGLHTAYREHAIEIAVGLELLGGPSSPKRLRELGTCERTGDILRANHYGWFERLGLGVYGLSGDGRRALVENADLVVCIRERFLRPGGDRD